MVILLSRGWVKKYYYYFRFLLPAKLQMWARILAGYAGYILLGSCLCRKKKSEDMPHHTHALTSLDQFLFFSVISQVFVLSSVCFTVFVKQCVIYKFP